MVSIKTWGVGAVAAAALTLGFAPSAHAAGQNGDVEYGEFAFYYNSNFKGSLVDFAAAKSNLAGYTFVSSGAGVGSAVKNNSASIYNARDLVARVYYNSGYAGPYDQVGAMGARNLANTYNQNASFRWGPF